MKVTYKFNKYIAKIKEEEEDRIKRKKFKKPLPLESKKDHIKQIFSTLNFKPKPTSYTEDYEYSDEKKHDTLNPDLLHHYKKSFMKTYEQEKMKHKIIIRK